MESDADTDMDALADVTDDELTLAVEQLLEAAALELARCPCCGGLTLVRRTEHE